MPGIPGVALEAPALFGRAADGEEVLRILSQDFRAALLTGEVGAGRTAFLDQVLHPALVAHGMTPVAVSATHADPAEGFANALFAATSAPVNPGERPVDYLLRVTAGGHARGNLVFTVDDLDLALGGEGGPSFAGELGGLLLRLWSRPGGKVRFLCTAADVRVHALDPLERRTGSIFPIAARHALGRLPREAAGAAVADALGRLGVSPAPDLVAALLDALDEGRGALPAEVRLAARAARELGLATAAQVGRAGGARALLVRHVAAAARSTGDRRRALRLLAALAARPGAAAADELGRRAGVTDARAAVILASLAERGILVPAAAARPEWPAFALAHERLAGPALEATAGAGERAREARARLAATAAGETRLTVGACLALRREGVDPSSPTEAAVVARARRWLLGAAAALVALPLLVAGLLLLQRTGTYRLAPDSAGGPERLVVRSGFGARIADTGVSGALVAPADWQRLRAGGLSGDAGATRDGRREYVTRSIEALAPPRRGLVRYVLEPSDLGPLRAVATAADSADEWAALLEVLRPVATGGDERELVTAAVGFPEPEVQAQALALAAAAEARRPGSYRALLAKALAAPDARLRRRAVGTLRELPAAARPAILALAFAAADGAAVRAEILGALGGAELDAPAAAAVGAALLADPASDPGLRQRGWDALDRALARDPAAALAAVAGVLGGGIADEATKVQLLAWVGAAELAAPPPEALAAAVGELARAPSAAVQAAALPLFARLAPVLAATELRQATNTAPAYRIALAEAWGELAREYGPIAAAELGELLDDAGAPVAVRAAAARAYGRVGKDAQERLRKLAKDGGEVGAAAVEGLVASVEAGGPPGAAGGALDELWRKKGASRRQAARAYARLARSRPAPAVSMLAAAARDKHDDALRALGVDGLCGALDGPGARPAGAALLGLARSEHAEVRARLAACLLARPKAGLVGKLAPALAADGGLPPAVRLDVARAVGASGAIDAGLARLLARLTADGSREVRLAALAALAGAAGAPGGEPVRDAIRAAWLRAGDGEEKLAALAVAGAIGDEATIRRAALDASAAVRAQAFPAAARLAGEAADALGRALADEDPGVRRAALRFLAEEADSVGGPEALQMIAGALDDPDRRVAAAARDLWVAREEPARLAARVRADLAAPSERVRAAGAALAGRLAVRDAATMIPLLEAALRDPARDVRVAATGALAAAYASSRPPAELADLLRGAESDALRRLAVAGALTLRGAPADGREAVTNALAPLAERGPPFVALTARLAASLIGLEADGVGFFLLLVP